MPRFQPDDLTPISPDAAELIDSAQDAAKKLARCCAEKDAEIAEQAATIERYQHQVLDQHAEIARLQEAHKQDEKNLRLIERTIKEVVLDNERLREALVELDDAIHEDGDAENPGHAWWTVALNATERQDKAIAACIRIAREGR